MTEAFVPTSDGSLFYELAGEGLDVTLIHAGLWDRRTWDREFAAWPALGFRVLRYDVRGYGRSAFPEAAFSNTEDLLAILDAADIAETALVGCSMGGGIALQFTLEHPDRVRGLIMVNSGLAGFEWSDERWGPVWEPIDAALERGDLEVATDLALGIWAPLGTADDAGSTIRSIALDNTQNFALDEADLERTEGPPALTRLEEVDVPTLVITGSRDVPEMIQIGEILAARIPGAVPAKIEGADHVANLRQPEAFDALVVPFLQQLT